MEFFAVGWLVVLIAAAEGAPERAALYLGILGLARAIPAVLLGLVAGVFVDRIDRRVLLIVCHAIFGLTFGGLGLATLTGNAPLWVVLVAGALYAATSVLYVPTRQAIQARLVGERDLPSAIGFVGMSLNAYGFIGPLLGGLLIIPFGAGGVMLISGLAQLPVIAALTFLRPYPVAGVGPRTGVGRSVADGLRYVRSQPVLFWLLVAYGANLFLVDPYADLLPAFTSEVLRMGPTELSWLIAAASVGSLVASLTVASVRGLQRFPFLTTGALVLGGLLLALFVRQRDIATLLLVAGGIGFATIFAGASLNLILQTTTPDHMRGRVSSLSNLLVDAGSPIGAVLLGLVATAIGIDQALGAAGLVLAAICVAVGLRPAVMRVRPPASPPATAEPSSAASDG